MIKNLVRWAVGNRLVVILLALALMAFGVYSFTQVNVEAYPDPAPAIVEVVAQYPGASAEEVERLVTIPLEVALANMPGLKYTRSQSLFELCHIRNQFEYGVSQAAARQEIINRLRDATLPAGVLPQISPQSPTGEILRYVLRNPLDDQGRPIYSLNDLKSLQDYTLQRAFRRVKRIADVVSFGGTVKRYEVRPDPNLMQSRGITLAQLENALANSNANVGGQYVVQGETVQVVRSLGLIGQGQDPIDHALGMSDAIAARDYLRAEEARRIREIRQIVLATTNNVAVHVDDVVEGGRLLPDMPVGAEGVVVSHQTRLGRVMLSRPKRDSQGHEIRDSSGNCEWDDQNDVVEGVVLLRKGEQSLPALKDVDALVEELNAHRGRLLPGVKLERCYDRSSLIHVTTHTVRENLLAGMGLVTVVLLMFLGNVRTALIVAINVPLALLFAFAMLFLRDKSANLLSIGAVDFGIILDSSVIMVENIYRHLASDSDTKRSLRERILGASEEIQRSLLFSTIIMVCAFLPLFTMTGPEGQIFGPMADTYAFALGGALLLAMTLSPVLCSLFMRRFKPRPPNLLVRGLQAVYLRQLRWCLRFRWAALLVFGGIVGLTLARLPWLGREFMPELEEGNLWIRGTFPLNTSLEETTRGSLIARQIMQGFPEVDFIITQVGRPDDGTDPEGFYYSEHFVPLRPSSEWPIPPGRTRPRTKPELVEELNKKLTDTLIGVEWNFSQAIRDMVMETLSGVGAENSVKVISRDLGNLESTADKVARALSAVPGIKNVGIYHIMGQSNLTLPVDRRSCAQWNVAVGDVQDVVATSIGGKAFSQMIEGERSFDITVRWPAKWRSNETAILDIPVEVLNNNVTSGSAPSISSTTVSGAASGPSPSGSSVAQPSMTGSGHNAPLNALSNVPYRRLRDLVVPVTVKGRIDPTASHVERGASTIYREQGNRLIAIKFDVHGRDLASTVSEAKRVAQHLIDTTCKLEWGGEFQEMEQAEGRLAIVMPLAIGLVVIMLYIAFRSLVDILLVLSNVLALFCGGIWALLLTDTNFSISAAVGFISIFGVGITNGLLLVSSFHRLRLAGLPMEEALLRGSLNRLRPMMMTVLTASLGLLPAALSTRIGAQSQRPLAIVVIGGMVMALLLNQYLTPVLYSLFRKREPSLESSGLAE